MTKYLVAAKGFSASGVSMTAGEYVSNQFDEQTIKVLQRMGRLVETEVGPSDVGPAEEPEPTKAEKKTAAKTEAAPLPGLPGA